MSAPFSRTKKNVIAFYANLVWITNKTEVSIGNIGSNILKSEYDINITLHGPFCTFKA